MQKLDRLRDEDFCYTESDLNPLEKARQMAKLLVSNRKTKAQQLEDILDVNETPCGGETTASSSSDESRTREAMKKQTSKKNRKLKLNQKDATLSDSSDTEIRKLIP